MQLGFVTAILHDLSLEEVLNFAKAEGYDCVEVMCWPVGKAARRYAGVTHIDVDNFRKAESKRIKSMTEDIGVSISGLGYYPNPLSADEAANKLYLAHIKKVIKAASLLEINQMNTFIGRDPRKTVDENWPQFRKTWKPIIKFAEKYGVRIGIENCPMLFTNDEWPGGKNLATTPAIWQRMFEEIKSDYFGLNYDPSHMIWQQMNYLLPMKNFSSKLFHIHAKDVRIDRERLDQVGIMATPLEYHVPKLPGLGEVNWGKFFSVLSDTGYDGAVCVEVEDRSYEGTLESRKASLRQAATYLRQFIPPRSNQIH